MLSAEWKRPAKSQSNGNCPQARVRDDGMIELRNDTNPDAVVVFNRGEWDALGDAFRTGEYLTE